MRTRVFSSSRRAAAVGGGDGCVKMKLLLLFFLLALLMIACRRSLKAPFFGREKQQQKTNYSTYYSPLHQNSLHSKGYTILMNTWKRNDLLMQSISHYSSCHGLASIHIVWSEPDPPSPLLIHCLRRVVRSRSAANGQQIELKFDFYAEDSLNNRFKEPKDLKTDAVFSVDDDVLVPCSSVELAFAVWRSAPDTMVGFVPRVHYLDRSDNGGKGEKYMYGGWWSVWWMGTYSMVLSKAAFFHNKYLSFYTHQMPPSIRNYVTQNRNCEDIAMSFLVANETNAPPVWVEDIRNWFKWN